MQSQYVDTAAALSKLAAQLKSSDWLAIDTEFIREKTYYPRLALVQVATDDAIACIDPLALDTLDPLLVVLFDKNITKVLHAGRQDQELFFNMAGKLPAPLFDTQVAAALCGWADQVGYGALVKDVTGVQLDKGHARTDWMRRPLPEDALAYAADDVRYLGQVYRYLRDSLEQRGRLEWIDDELASLSDPATYQAVPEDAWQRVRGLQKLKPNQLRVLAEVAAWREKTAMQVDRPRKWLIGDDILLDIARRSPTNRDDLMAIRGAAQSTLKSHADEVLQRISLAQEKPPLTLPAHRERLTPEQEAMADMLMAIVRQAGAEQAISPANLATRKQIARLVTGDKTINVLQGWRRHAVGEALLAVLNGQTSARIEAGKVVLE